jgi:PAS domain S-box-containing protein
MPATRSQPIKLLICTESDLVFDRVSRALAPPGFRPERAASADEALAAALAQRFDTFVLDSRFGAAGGIELTGRMSALGHTPVIVLGTGDRDLLGEAVAAGAQHYVPLTRRGGSVEELARAIRVAVERGRRAADQKGRAGGTAPSAAARGARERRAQAALLQTILDHIPLMLLYVDAAGRVLWGNRELGRVLGWSADHLVAAHLSGELYAEPGDRVRAEQHAAAADGTWQDIRLRTRDGRIADTSWTLIRVADGTMIIIGRDVSEHRSLERQLAQAEKLEAIGRLAGGIAHDFNNLVTVITGYAQLLLEELPAGTSEHAEAAEIARAGESARTLTQQLLAFSRPQERHPRVMDLNEAIANVRTMVERVIGAELRISFRLTPEPLPVYLEEGQVGRIVVNLALNARDAMPSGGAITIETSSVAVNASDLGRRFGLTTGRAARLVVADTGFGMDAATVERIFEPFFTTKEAGRGTGLGLPTVYAVVKQAGGGIDVQSEPGQGTSFAIYLPQLER